MPTSKLKEVYSLLAEWETKAKELAQIELLSQSKDKMEQRAKQLFEGIAFDQLGEEEEEDNAEMNIDTSNVEATSPLDTELSLATGEAATDEPLPTDTTVDAGAEFGWDDPAVSIAKDGNDDTVITIDAASLGATVNGNPDTAPASETQCTCPIHGGVDINTGGLETQVSPEENTIDNEVIDMTQEPDMDAILESFIALSENADENEVEIVSEDRARELAAREQNNSSEARRNASDQTGSDVGKAKYASSAHAKDGKGWAKASSTILPEAAAKSFEKLEGTKPMAKAGEAINEGEMEELTEEELKELDENMDTGAMMKALQEAFMGVQSGSGFVQESREEEDEDDDDDWDDDQAEAVKNVKKGRKLDVGNLDEDCEELEEGMNNNSRARAAEMQNTAATHRKNAGNAASTDGKDASAGFAKDSLAASKAGRNNEFKGKAPMQKLAEEEEELDEASQRTLANGKNQTLKPQTFPKNKLRSGLNESKKLMTKINQKMDDLLAENKRLQLENKEISTLNEGLETKLTAATNKFQEVKGKLYEASIIASKSTCMNKLFLEHVTTQDEKINIVENFGKAVSRTEVQNLFENFDKFFKKGTSTQLNENKNPLSKLNPLFKSEPTTQKALNEGTVYDNGFTEKMNHLINYGGKK